MSNTGTTPTATGVNYVFDESDHAVVRASFPGLSAFITYGDDFHDKVRDLIIQLCYGRIMAGIVEIDYADIK